MHHGKASFRVLFSFFLLTALAAQANAAPRHFFPPGLLLPVTEALLSGSPLFHQLRRLMVELNWMARELRRDPMREKSRARYQSLLDEAGEVQREFSQWLKEQEIPPAEIEKVQTALSDKLDKLPAFDAPEVPAPGGAVLVEPEPPPPPAVVATPGPKGELTVIEYKGKLLNRIPEAKKAAAGERIANSAESSGNTVFGPIRIAKEKLGRLGELLSGGSARQPSKPVIRSRAEGTVSNVEAGAPLFFEEEREIADDPSEPKLDWTRSSKVSLAGTELRDLPMSREAKGDFIQRLTSQWGGPVGPRGSWALVALLLTLIFSLPVAWRVAQRTGMWARTPGGGDLDFSKLPQEGVEDFPRMTRNPDSSYRIIWDSRLHCWVLLQRSRQNEMPHLVAEVKDGTVVYGALIGLDPQRRYQLSDQDEWLETPQPERLVLDVRRDLRSHRA
jgi:hypothetical protein